MTSAEALLVEYARNGSDHAFREVVGAYIHFVFSTALRVVGGDRHMAEDVTQTVFTDLARKAPVLPENVKLGGWLHRHTCFVGRKALRREHRRRARERRALELQVIGDYTEENLGQVASVLDEAINALGTDDRHAIVLRFFEQLDFRSVGKALGSSEDAARMRVSRAVQKLGTLLKRRGLVLSAAGLGFILSTKTVTAASPELAAGVCKVALSQGVGQMSVWGLLKQVCLTKLNIGLTTAAALIAVATLIISRQQTEAEAPMEVASEPAELLQTESPDHLIVTEEQPAPEPQAQLTVESKPPTIITSTDIAPPPAQSKPTKPLPSALPAAAAPAAVNPPIQPRVQTPPVVSGPRSAPQFPVSQPRWERNGRSGSAQALSFQAPTSSPTKVLPSVPPASEARPAVPIQSSIRTPPAGGQWRPVVATPKAGPSSARPNPSKTQPAGPAAQ